MAGVTLKGVQKRFDKTVVIKDLDLDVKEHEFMVLVGPFRVRQVTALRMIAGLEEISAGRSRSGTGWSTTFRPRTATSRWCSRATRSTRT